MLLLPLSQYHPLQFGVVAEVELPIQEQVPEQEAQVVEVMLGQQDQPRQDILELMVKVVVVAQEDLILFAVIILQAQVEMEW
jgi:uncharacterized protein YllA (UPF0747 family)